MQGEPSNATKVQPTAEELAKLGIKVRDFAYESTLPPVAPVYFLPKQIQPDPRVQEALLALCTDNRETGKRPASQAGGVTRQRGFCDIIRDYGALDSDIPDSQERVLYDQNSDYVKTPVVTPNGSLEWEDGEMDSMRKRTREVKGKGEAGGGRYCLRKRRERKAALPEVGTKERCR